MIEDLDIFSGTVKKEYQLCEQEKQPKIIQSVKDYLTKLLHKVSFSNGSFKAKYHGRWYHGTVSHSSKSSQKTIEGIVEINIDFPNINRSNHRLVRRIERELNLPCQHPSRYFM